MLQPERFGHYLLFDRLGTGKLTSVYLAKSAVAEDLEELLAVKRVHRALSADAELVQIILAAARISSSLSHPNIERVLDFGKLEGSCYLAAERIAGRDLGAVELHLCETARTMELPLILHVVARACQALDYAHRLKDSEGKPLGIVHRDVNPATVLISFDGVVKLIDFGVAEAKARATPTPSAKLPSVTYMAPEQVRGEHVDHRADIYSLGLVMYQLLTSQQLAQGTDPAERLERLRPDEIQPPSAINPDVPLEIERIVLKSLARDRKQRYGWASEFRADLERYIARTGSALAVEELAQWMRRELAGDLEAEHRLEQRLHDAGQALGTADEASACGLPAPDSPRVAADLERAGLTEVPALELNDESTLVGKPAFLDEGEASLPDTEPGVHLADLAVWASPPLAPAEDQLAGAVPTKPAAPGLMMPPQRGPGAIAPGPERAGTIVGGALDASSRMRRPTPAVDPAQPVDIAGLDSAQVERYDGQRPRSVVSAAPGPATHRVLSGRPRRLRSMQLILLVAGATLLLAGLVLLLLPSPGAESTGQLQSGKGTLIVTTTPPATCSVTIDGRAKGVLKPGASLSLTGIPVGGHQVTLQCLGFESYATQVIVKEAEASFISGALQPK